MTKQLHQSGLHADSLMRKHSVDIEPQCNSGRPGVKITQIHQEIYLLTVKPHTMEIQSYAVTKRAHLNQHKMQRRVIHLGVTTN